MEIITRELYSKKIDAWIGKGQIIVLTGSRRVGKSFILKDFVIRHQSDPDNNIIYVDKEKKDFGNIKTSQDLDTYIESNFKSGMHNFILLDEIQEIERFENSVRHWRTEKNTDIIVTGSNSKMLSSDISTRLSGRYQEIQVQPLSFNEFLRFHNIQDNDESLLKYLNYGGMPGLKLIGLDNEEMVCDYLSSVFDTIMLKEILERNEIRNIPFLKNLLHFYADNTGKINSASSISKYMKSQGEDVSSNAVLTYTELYSEAFLLDVVHRYDIHGKKLLSSNDKVYWNDVGLRNFVAGGNRESDIEKVIENVVYKHLRQLGFNVTVGQLRAGEIDFVCTAPGKTAYVQAAYIVSEEKNEEREFGPLEKLNDNYPKYVISMTPLLKSRDRHGITHLSLREFLTKGI